MPSKRKTAGPAGEAAQLKVPKEPRARPRQLGTPHRQAERLIWLPYRRRKSPGSRRNAIPLPRRELPPAPVGLSSGVPCCRCGSPRCGAS